MNIEEIKETDVQEDQEREELLYEFKVLDQSLFKNIHQKETVKLITKWGLDKDMELVRFRFNQSFTLFNTDKFLAALLSSPEVRASLPGLSANIPESVESVEFNKLSTEVVNMGFFDILDEKDITTTTGYIKKEPDEYLEGMVMGDRLRYALAFEESEFYEIFDDQTRKELIYRIMQHLVLGGSICQFEDNVKEYLDQTQNFYKDLVSVFKDSETDEIKVGSHAFEIKKINDTELFGDSDHPQNWAYVIVDPIHWHVNVWYHKWSSWW
ncbi:unnamed protein product [Moneuplotes crassus]|uniref:Cilia- and flagella-associated protein 300 n=1 Tax=Euplotes crassus TaxID=5936 RepID=A0AAD1XTL8_EUPCR|nr:unnamed protein product [Moneuplotes crassus]